MPRYSYLSKNAQGERVTALMEAESRHALLAQLKNIGLTPVAIYDDGEKKETAKSRIQRILESKISLKGISTGEMAVFWRQFATMIDSGLPLIEALQAIAQEVEHPVLQKALTQAVSDLWEGLSFSQALRRHPKIFSNMITALIAAAEESGSLSEVSQQIAVFLEKRDDLIRKVRTALTYPIFLVGFFLVLAGVATFVIIPRFKEIYSSFEAKLPPFTTLVFSLNELFLSNLHWIILGTAAFFAAVLMWARTAKGRLKLDWLILRFPIFGKILHRAAIARFTRSLSILLYGGVPVNRALEMVQDVTGNTVLARAIGAVREDILQGIKFAASLRKYEIFPKMAVRMVAVGEETGSMSGLLKKTAEFYESRVDAALATINTLIEPIIIVVIGAFVLVFVLSLYLPIFTLGMAMKG